MKRTSTGDTVVLYGEKKAKKAKTTYSVSRSLRYNGPTRITRVANYFVSTTAGSGFYIGTTNFQGVFMTFTPNDFTIWGDVANYVTGSVPNAAELSALYDRVMIEKVVVSMSFKGTDPAASSGANGVPRIWYAPDYTDGTSGNTISQTQQQGNCRFTTLSGDRPPTKVTVYPKFQQVIYYTAVVSAYEPKRGPIASGVSVPHYGLRIAMEPGLVGNGGIEFSVKYYFKLENVK